MRASPSEKVRKRGERAFTRSLVDFFPTRADVLVPIGDDAAVVRCRHPELVLKIDPVVEGVHFAPKTAWRLVGKKAVNRALSDLAAMGAVPDWLLVSVQMPKRMSTRERGQLFAGIRAAATAAGAVVVGGHSGSTSGPLTLDVVAVGHLEHKPLVRSGARVGDSLHVTGSLGGSRLGKHLRFTPRLSEGAWLAKQNAVSACMDVSDGLLLDLQTLLLASKGKGAVLLADAIPVSAAARRLARGSQARALRHALTDGEDFELLFCVRGTLGRGGPLKDLARRPIGFVVAEPGIWIADANGHRRRVEAKGYQHDL